MTSTVSDGPGPWWKNVVCYQIWPLSFKDSNNDGKGDIRGVISKLDYLKDLGVDVIWLSPTYQSPMKDCGYDVSDYQAIHEWFGTLTDMENLIEETHNRGMKILLDLVVTHTSDQHRWFQKAKRSRTNDKADHYIFLDGRRDSRVQEPTNWRAAFGGPTWTYVKERDQYYCHLFLPSVRSLTCLCHILGADNSL